VQIRSIADMNVINYITVQHQTCDEEVIMSLTPGQVTIKWLQLTTWMRTGKPSW